MRTSITCKDHAVLVNLSSFRREVPEFSPALGIQPDRLLQCLHKTLRDQATALTVLMLELPSEGFSEWNHMADD